MFSHSHTIFPCETRGRNSFHFKTLKEGMKNMAGKQYEFTFRHAAHLSCSLHFLLQRASGLCSEIQRVVRMPPLPFFCSAGNFFLRCNHFFCWPSQTVQPMPGENFASDKTLTSPNLTENFRKCRCFSNHLWLQN